MSRAVLDKPRGQPTSATANYYRVAFNSSALFIRTSGVKGQQKLLFPLETGTSWSYSNEYGSNDERVRDDFDCKAIGWEQVVVPAGTFWALRVELNGWRTNLSSTRRAGQLSQLVKGTLWYSPEAKHPVKSIYRTHLDSGGGTRLSITTTQLVQFTSAASKTASATTGTK
jgi:hypothetical protein